MPYQKNPDTQPGKPNQSNIAAQENQATGGAQLVSFTQKPITAYGPGGSSNVAFDAKGRGIVGPIEATNADLNQHTAGKSSEEDLKEVNPSSNAIISGTGIQAPVIPSVVKPTISPSSRNFSDTITITLASVTGGAAIYYTLDGTIPTVQNRIAYSVPFVVTQKSVIITAYATKTDMQDSTLAVSDFTFAPDVGTSRLFGYSKENNANPLEDNALYELSASDGSVSQEIAKFAPDLRFEQNEAIALNFDDNKLYHFALRINNEENSTYIFEKIDTQTLIPTAITLDASGLNQDFGTSLSMVYAGEGSFILGTTAGLYGITSSGVMSVLTNSITNISGLAFKSGVLYGVNADDNSISSIDTGAWTIINGVSMTSDDGVISDSRGLVTVGSNLVVSVQIGEGVQYLKTVDETTGVTTSLINNIDRFYSLANVKNDSTSVYGVTDSETNNVLNVIPSSLYKITLTGTVPDADETTYLLLLLSFIQYLYDFNNVLAILPEEMNFYRLYSQSNYLIEADAVLKFDVSSLEEPVSGDIPLTGFIFDQGDFVGDNGFIEDGGNDMLDGGNYITTDLSSNHLQYTHTKQNGSENNGLSFAEHADGTIQDGTVSFGPGSSYFTNMYAGMFVMVARNMAISDFHISGNVGADGGGTLLTQDFSITSNSQAFSVYTKSIGDAGDPSFTHFMIVPGNGAGITHTTGVTTDDDQDNILGLTGINRIYYFVLARTSGQLIASDDVIAAAQAFADLVSGGSTIQDDLSNLNAGRTSVTSLIPTPFVFSDYGNDGEYINQVQGISGQKSLVYIGNDTFMCSADNGLAKITTDGVVTQVNDGSTSITALAYLNGILYGIQNVEGWQLVTIDLDTGNLSGFTNISLDGNLNTISGMAVYDNRVLVEYLLNTEDESLLYELGELDVGTGTISSVSELATGIKSITSIV